MSTHTQERRRQASLTPGSWLNGLKVLSLGNSYVLEVAARALTQFGTTAVTRIDREAPFDPAGADIVLVDRVSSTQPCAMGSGPTASEYMRFVSQNNPGVWVTASAYGLQTSQGNAIASDMVLLASGGVLGHSRPEPEALPTLPAGEIALALVGVTMAMSALHARHEHLSSGVPVHVDVSGQAAVIAAGMCLEIGHALGNCPGEGGSSRYGAPTGFFPCRDGSVYVVVLEQHQWQALRSGLSPLLDEFATIEDARKNHLAVNEAVAAWTAARTNVECETTLQAGGVPCTAVNTVDEFYSRADDAGRPAPSQGDSVQLPAVVEESRTRSDGRPRTKVVARSLAQLRVLDGGHVLAVPLATSWLGAMGAQVTKLEDPARLDVYRRRGPYAGGISGLNRSAYFNQVNYCKTGLDVTVGADGSSLSLEQFDVVVHNLSPHRARAVGVDGASVMASDDVKLSITSSGFGASGEWATYRAYGHNIHAFAGLVAATRDANGNMDDVGTPWADPLAGIAVATWVLAWSLAEQHDRSTAVDLSMAELMAAQLDSLRGQDPDKYYEQTFGTGGFFIRSPADNGVVAVSLHSDADRDLFEEIAGHRVTLPTRRAGELAPAYLGHLELLDSRAIVDRLRSAGLAAARVTTAHELAVDLFVRSTGLFQSVDSLDLGRYEVTGLPWTFVDRGRGAVTAAPERPVSSDDPAGLPDRSVHGFADS